MYLTQLLNMIDAFRETWKLWNQIACRLDQLTLQLQPGLHLLISEYIYGFLQQQMEVPSLFLGQAFVLGVGDFLNMVRVILNALFLIFYFLYLLLPHHIWK